MSMEYGPIPTLVTSEVQGFNMIVPSAKAVAVTPHDTNDIDVTRSLYVGTQGTLKVDMASGDTVTFATVPAGTTLPIRVSRVYSTGTSAASIVALY